MKQKGNPMRTLFMSILNLAFVLNYPCFADVVRGEGRSETILINSKPTCVNRARTEYYGEDALKFFEKIKAEGKISGSESSGGITIHKFHLDSIESGRCYEIPSKSIDCKVNGAPRVTAERDCVFEVKTAFLCASINECNSIYKELNAKFQLACPGINTTMQAFETRLMTNAAVRAKFKTKYAFEFALYGSESAVQCATNFLTQAQAVIY